MLRCSTPRGDELSNFRPCLRHLLGRRGLRRAAGKRRFGVIFHLQLNGSGDGVPGDFRHQRQGEIDAGSDARAADTVAVTHHPLIHRLRAQQSQLVDGASV